MVTTAGHGTAERQRVLEVRERRAQPVERTRHGPRHPQLLRARRERNRLDAVGHEVGTPRQRREPEIASGSRELAQQVLDVRLVPGALAAEDVRVEHDEDVTRPPRDRPRPLRAPSRPS